MAAFQTETDLDLGLDTPLPHDGHEVADGALAVAKPPTSKTVPAFVTKLLAMINDVSTNHLISWSENGDTFRVHNAAALAKEVLPRYYKHSNFTSLVRQLNMYGFHKVVALDTGLQSTDQQWEFVHPCVQRGRPELLVHIKRKDGGTTRAKRVTREDMDEVMSGLQTMQGTQSQLSTKFEEMQRQNQALWQEVTVLRQRHEQQRAMINKIMMFLTRLVQQPATLGNGAPASKRPRHLALQDTANAADLPTVSELDHSSPPFSNEPLTALNFRHAMNPELSSVDSELAATRSKLAAQGVDSNLLNSLWQAAALQPATSEAGWPGSGHEDQVHYEPLPVIPDDLGLDLDTPGVDGHGSLPEYTSLDPLLGMEHPAS
eukprot:m.60895 g.60895  ORF g.60895 m.60895 type:complete len:374 (+) comp13866_c0_seq1:174-1295(+)